MAIAAISSGTNAMSEPNTNASTISAPRPPMRVSTRTLGPSDSSLSPTASGSYPVIEHRGARDGGALGGRLGLVRRLLGGLEHDVARRIPDHRERGAAVVRDEGAIAGGGVVGVTDVRDRVRDLGERRPDLLLDAGRVDRRALRELDDRGERPVDARPARAQLVEDGIRGIGALATRELELVRQGVHGRRHRPERHDGDEDPRGDHPAAVAQDPAGERPQLVSLSSRCGAPEAARLLQGPCGPKAPDRGTRLPV